MQNAIFFLMGLLLLCVIFLGIDHYRIEHLDGELYTAQNQVTQLQQQNKAFAVDADTQNAQIAAFKAKADMEHTNAVLAMSQAQKASEAYVRAAQKLDQVRPTGNECKDTFTYIDTHFKGIK